MFTTDSIEFNDDGSATVTIFGAKNDLDRKGFQLRLPPHSNVMLNPVECVRCYIHTTRHKRQLSYKPVFISLTRPYRAISSSQVANVLNEVIKLAGFSNPKYTAKMFRASGATAAVDSGTNPEIIRKLGRWKTPHVFYERYVHSLTPVSLIESVLRC